MRDSDALGSALRGTLMHRTLVTTLLAIGLAASSGCAGKPEAIEAAKAKGYLNPRVIKTYTFTSEFHCFDEDETGYELEALDRQEHPVKLIACCEFTCSIREALF